jgi:hypothetical protein
LGIRTKPVTTDYPTQNGELRSAKPNEIIAAMYDVNTLTPVENKVLTFFTDLPSEPISYERLENTFADNEGLDEILLNLAQKGWLDYNENDSTFKMQPIIQTILSFHNA